MIFMEQNGKEFCSLIYNKWQVAEPGKIIISKDRTILSIEFVYSLKFKKLEIQYRTNGRKRKSGKGGGERQKLLLLF